MKKTILFSLFFTLTSEAATLTCQPFKASRVTSGLFVKGVTDLGVNMVITGASIGTPQIKNFWVTISYPDPSIGEALKGNYIHILPNVDYQQSAPIHIGDKLTGLSGQVIQIPCVSTETNHCASKKHNWLPIISSGSTSVSPASVNKNITVPSGTNLVSTELKATSNHVNMPDLTLPGETTLFAIETTEDSVTFPDEIDLGYLSPGISNNAQDIINYSKNTNNLNVRLSPTYSLSSPLTVNDIPQYSSATFKPPFTIGLYVSPSSQPGTKSVQVTASWTCP
ncbi:hypothetical protein [Enterobacter kobei]|uniref:hypothetical protein n=1 Tax=Enterobacter kobei TaxID=208224 RepID=UPI0018C2E62C|nr:hypothetical protein [Enterobacter kobei]MBG0580810.1 hypothetical protein [Enterobacter kobei]